MATAAQHLDFGGTVPKADCLAHRFDGERLEIMLADDDQNRCGDIFQLRGKVLLGPHLQEFEKRLWINRFSELLELCIVPTLAQTLTSYHLGYGLPFVVIRSGAFEKRFTIGIERDT